MAIFTKQILSGSADGKSIQVSATVIGSANAIHTAHATSKDEVWIYAFNNDTVSRALSIIVDGVVISVVGIPAKEGLVLVIPGMPVTNALVVGAFAEVTNVIYVSGWVNRIT